MTGSSGIEGSPVPRLHACVSRTGCFTCRVSQAFEVMEKQECRAPLSGLRGRRAFPLPRVVLSTPIPNRQSPPHPEEPLWVGLGSEALWASRSARSACTSPGSVWEDPAWRCGLWTAGAGARSLDPGRRDLQEEPAEEAARASDTRLRKPGGVAKARGHQAEGGVGRARPSSLRPGPSAPSLSAPQTFSGGKGRREALVRAGTSSR